MDTLMLALLVAVGTIAVIATAAMIYTALYLEKIHAIVSQMEERAERDRNAN